MKQGTPEKVTSIEQLLFEHVERLKRNPAGRRAVVMHLSRLRPDNRGTHQIRIAANTFEALVKQFDGQIFVLQQGDIVFVCKECERRRGRRRGDQGALSLRRRPDRQPGRRRRRRLRHLVRSRRRRRQVRRLRRGASQRGRAPAQAHLVARRLGGGRGTAGDGCGRRFPSSSTRSRAPTCRTCCAARRSAPSFRASRRSRSIASSMSRSPTCATPSCRGARSRRTGGSSNT